MSQISVYLNNSGPGGFVQTLTGNTGGPVSPTAGNINVLSDGTTFTTENEPTGYYFIGNVEANTLTFKAVPYTAQTVGATSASPFNLTLPASSSVFVSAEVIAAKDDFTLSIGGFVSFVAQNDGGGAAFVGSPEVNTLDNAGGTVEFIPAVAGNDVSINVSGTLGETWNWTLFVRYTLQM